jgi:hypothetical protein
MRAVSVRQTAEALRVLIHHCKQVYAAIMSAREIIAEIEALPQSEKAEVMDYVQSQLTQASTSTAPQNEVKYADPEKFKRAVKEVFATHAPLFKKLAK